MPSQIAEVDRFSISAILFLTVPLNLSKLLLKTSVSLPLSLFGSLSLSLLGPLSYMCTCMGAVAFSDNACRVGSISRGNKQRTHQIRTPGCRATKAESHLAVAAER